MLLRVSFSDAIQSRDGLEFGVDGLTDAPDSTPGHQLLTLSGGLASIWRWPRRQIPVLLADPPPRHLRTKIRRFKYVGNPRIYPGSRFAHALPLPNELSRQGDSNAARESSRCI